METSASTDPDGDVKLLLNIFMVNFSTPSARDRFIPMVEMVKHLVPEATVTEFDLLKLFYTTSKSTSYDLGSAPSNSLSDVNIASDWITGQARSLLELVRDSTLNGAAVLLSGYGLGGILIKQTIAIANSDPEFYHLASQVTCLVFFNPPHEPTGDQPWEGVLLELIKTTSSTRLQKGLYAAVSSLARHVSNLSNAFIEFVPKYRIRNIVSQLYKKDHASPTRHLSQNSILNNLRTWDEWPNDDELGDCAFDNLPALELLREVFAPTWLEGLINTKTSKAYSNVLEVLSPSNRILGESQILDSTDMSESLKAVYKLEFSSISFEKVRGGCVLITALGGTGKSAVVRLLSQHLQAQSSLVVINNYPRTIGNTENPMNLYEVLVSTLRQILSQKPSLFTSALRTVLSELLEQNSWGDGVMESLISVLFAQARETEFLVVVHDYQSHLWPDEARSWWSQLLKSVESSHGPRGSSSTCTLLISRNQATATDSEINLGDVYHHIDLTINHRLRINDFVGKELARMVSKSHLATSGLLRGQRGVAVREVIAAKAEGFSISFREISDYLDHVLQSFALSTLGVIQKAVEDSPRTSEEFYCQVIHRLSNDKISLPWATATLSWALHSARPLHVQELACAVAIRLDQTYIGEMDVTLNIEADITSNLGGLLCVENGYARVATATAREVLRKRTVPGGAMELMGHDKLFKHCLHYLKVLFGGKATKLSEHAFLNYATRYWPAHFSAIENPDDALCEEVVQFFQESPAADWWYHLYFGYCSLPLNDRTGSPVLQREGETVPLKSDDGLKLSPVDMACDAGIWPVVSYLLAGDHVGGTYHDVSLAGVDHLQLTVRRDGWGRKMIFMEGITSKMYLECAIAADDVDAVAMLLASGDKNIRERILSYRPLHIAALVGSPRMVQLIVNDGDFRENEATRMDENGRSALHFAALNGEPKVVRILLALPLPGPKSSKSNAVGKGESHIPINDPAARDKNFETPLHLAARAGNIDAARVLVEFSRSKNQSITVEDRSGRTPAHYAVESCPELLKDIFTVESREELAQKDRDGLTPLHFAARGGFVEATVNILDIAGFHGKLDDVMLASDIKGRLPIHYASENGHHAVLSLFLKNMGTLKVLELPRDKQGYTPETLAAIRGHLEIIKMLHIEGKEWDAMLLARAAEANQILIVEYLLRQGVSPDGNPDSDTTPLCLAAIGGFVQIVRSLLRHGARINLPNSNRQAPLYLAVQHKRRDVAEILLDSGRETHNDPNNAPTKSSEAVVIDAPDSLRLTALHVAASNGEMSLVKILIDRGADVVSRSRTKQIPLHLAVQAGHLEIARLLVNKKRDSIFAVDNKSKTPIGYAIDNTNLSMILILFEQIKAENIGGPARISDGIYPLEDRRCDVVAAIEKSAVRIVDFMLHLFPEIMQYQNPNDEDSMSLLHIAAKTSTAEIVALLLKLGISVNLAGANQRTPLHVAILHSNIDAIKRLLEENPNLEAIDDNGRTPLLTAIYEGVSEMGEICRLLLEAEASINNPGSSGKFPLFEASYYGRVDVVQVLLDFGADVNQLSANSFGEWSSLHAGANNVDICRELVGKGANINCQNSQLWTPLHLACAWESVGTVRFFLEHNAEVNVLNEDGDAPLHIALEKNDEQIAEALIKHKATSPGNTVDFQLPRRNGQRPIHLAAAFSSTAIVKAIAQQVGQPGLQLRTLDGLTCLDIAIRVSNVGVPETLLEVGDWEYNELAKCFRSTIETGDWKLFKLLIEKDPSLADGTIYEGGLGANAKVSRIRYTGVSWESRM